MRPIMGRPQQPEAVTQEAPEVTAVSDASSSSSSSISSSSSYKKGESWEVPAPETSAAAGLEVGASDRNAEVTVAPRTPPENAALQPPAAPLPEAAVQPAAQESVAASPAAPGGHADDAPAEQEMPQPQLKRPKKLGKISFNLQGGAIAAAQAKVQVEEAVAAARARRLNTKDASTQTVRDPEHQDGEIVTIWRLRPRGMESFPHFPKAAKRKVREPTICAAAEGEEDESFAAPGVKPGEPQKDTRKRRLDAGAGPPQHVSESPERATLEEEQAPAADGLQAGAPPVSNESDSDEDSPASDVVQAALARTAHVQDAVPV